jgi:hypothetical protein
MTVAEERITAMAEGHKGAPMQTAFAVRPAEQKTEASYLPSGRFILSKMKSGFMDMKGLQAMRGDTAAPKWVYSNPARLARGEAPLHPQGRSAKAETTGAYMPIHKQTLFRGLWGYPRKSVCLWMA